MLARTPLVGHNSFNGTSTKTRIETIAQVDLGIFVSTGFNGTSTKTRIETNFVLNKK